MRIKAESSHSPSEEMRAVIRRGRDLMSQAVRASWASGLITRDDDVIFPGVLVGKEVVGLLDRIEAELTAPIEPARRVEIGVDPALGRVEKLVELVGGTGIAFEVLVLALAVELDSSTRMLAAYLRGAAIGSALTVGTLARALGEHRIAELLAATGAGAPLRRHRILEVGERAGDLQAAATVRAAPRLTRWLVDPTGIDEEVAGFAHLLQPIDRPMLSQAALATVEEAVEEVRGLLAAQRRGRGPVRDVVLRGPRGAGRGEIAREACRRLGVPVLATHVGALFGEGHPGEAAAALLREALLAGAQVLLEGGESLTGTDEPSQRLRLALGSSVHPLLITTSNTSGDSGRLSSGRGVVLRDVPIAATHEREEVWSELLPEVPAPEVASLYRVGVGAMARIASGARLRAEVRGRPDRVETSDLAQAVRSEFETDLGTVAIRIDVTQTWGDLVVPDDTGRTIAELVDQLRHRSTVLGRWGFSRKLGKGLGTTALFSGEPGTGKSMVAGLIARELGLELYQIDLSRVLSKWIGETEKNLAKVFDAAETGHVVLLFDEADALMGKRTADVKSSNDRYANLETNYILQRLEAFHGVAILTSNLESSIDPALSRRLSFELRFPFPDEEQRAHIWRRMLPDELPVTGEIDFALLASRFELAGGHIRNIVLRAAYLAAADEKGGRELSMAHILRAAEYEYHDHGMLVAKGRLKG